MAIAANITDDKGRSFQGTLVKVVNDDGRQKAKIRRIIDGRLFLVPLDSLSAETLKYIESQNSDPFALSSIRWRLEEKRISKLVIPKIEIELFVQIIESFTRGGETNEPNMRFLIQEKAKGRRVSVDASDVSLAEALDEITSRNGLEVLYKNGQVIIKLSDPLAVLRDEQQRARNDLPDSPEWLARGIDWLCSNQRKDGTWGLAGTSVPNARNPKRNHYPMQSATLAGDAGTTAVTIMALLNYLATDKDPKAQQCLDQAVDNLLELVRKGDASPSDQASTLVERKLGPAVNTALVAQALAKVYLELPSNDRGKQKVEQALDICLGELNENHDRYLKSTAGWANILQATACLVAWEYAQLCGRQTDSRKLDELRACLTGIFNEAANTFDLTRAAGINLYSFASALRANAKTAGAALRILPPDMASKPKGSRYDRVGRKSARGNPRYLSASEPHSTPTEFDYLSDPIYKHLVTRMEKEKALALCQAYRKNEKLLERLDSDNALLRGFGNNGGEEYLSFYLIGQALQLVQEDMWKDWRSKVVDIVKSQQNPDGSWVGKHCITDSSFCTATVILSVLADRDGMYLRAIRDSSKEKPTSSHLVRK